jgi:Uma2 family endonuclease
MTLASMSYVTLPYFLSSEEDEGETVLRIPPDVYTLDGFRRWVHGQDFPEKLKAHYIQGNIYIDMAQESIQTHVLVKTAVFQTLPNLMDEENLGEFYTDGVLLTNRQAQVSNNPNGVAVLWATIEAGRVRYIKQKGVETEIQGTPDWVMEIVSNSSVHKDKRHLRSAYHAAKIPEYWLIDARGEDIKFQILQWRKSGYVPASIKDGWQHSKVFGHDFQLTRQQNRRGAWKYTLLVNPERGS